MYYIKARNDVFYLYISLNDYCFYKKTTITFNFQHKKFIYNNKIIELKLLLLLIFKLLGYPNLKTTLKVF